MTTIPHRELRNRSSDVLRRVQAGETIQATYHGEVVAVRSPAGPGRAPRVALARRRGGGRVHAATYAWYGATLPGDVTP